MPDPIGRSRWAIAEGYSSSSSHGPEPQMTSHETACVLNPNPHDAHVGITVFFADRDPAGRYRVTVPARGTRHIRFNQLDDPETDLKGTDYASVLEADVPVVVQHTRLNSRQSELALISTIAYAGGV